MKIPLYVIDAFTEKRFSGNPAAVCLLSKWLPDETLQAIAAENNLSETAFFVGEGEIFNYIRNRRNFYLIIIMAIIFCVIFPIYGYCCNEKTANTR